MIKGWKNNPAWVKIYAEKKATHHQLRLDRIRAEMNTELIKNTRGLRLESFGVLIEQ